MGFPKMAETTNRQTANYTINSIQTLSSSSDCNEATDGFRVEITLELMYEEDN